MSASPVLDAANLLLDCACTALNDTRKGCPARTVVMIGDLAAWDQCCPDGQLTAVVTLVYPSITFPEVDLRPPQCGAPFSAFNVDLEIVRCGPTMDDEGNPPTMAQLVDVADWVHEDAWALRMALRCCLFNLRQTYDSIERGQMFLNDGACYGSRTTMTLGLRRAV